ncbi:MAG TPA: alkaline phosphatase family protein [Acidimicrobiales bacterium]
MPLSRRQLLGGALVGASTALAGCSSSSGSSPTSRAPAIALRQPGSLPFPGRPVGVDQLPQIDHIVVVMMENHSFDNVLGLIGRGDGFAVDQHGRPTATNPDGHGNLVRSFHMPTECQTRGIGNDWRVTHEAYNHGLLDGFVTSTSAESMGYLTKDDLPFTCGLAGAFPIADRYFCSAMAQTDPNRRFLIAGTSLGLIDDTFPPGLPPNGVIFEQFNKYGITWKDYYSSLPTLGVFLPLLQVPSLLSGLAGIDQFYADAAAGTLPSFSLVEPNYEKQSEEDPQDVQFGDQFLGKVVNAVMSGPGWPSTMLIWTYDEHGGYYDHVAPPAAVTPDDIPPTLGPADPPGAFDRYGFRVPAGVVSPFARRDFVSHAVYDHTSILKTVEEKWNLPALTRRDANANSLFAMVDLRSKPAFSTPPVLPAPADPTAKDACLTTGAGVIPPPSAVKPA